MSIRADRGRFLPVLITFSVLLAFAAPSHAAPTNEELYQMILELKQGQASLRHEAEQAQAEAEAAKRELAQTRGELEAARAELQRISATPVLRTEPAPRRGGFQAGLEALYLQPSAEKLTYAIVDPVDGPVAGKTGGNIEPGLGSRTRSIDPDAEPGFRAELGYAIPGSGTDVALRFSYLDAESRDSVSEPAGGEIVSPLTASRTGLEDADRAEGLFTLDYRALDLEVGQSLMVGRSAEFRLFGGLRYGSLKPTLEARYFGDQFDPANPGRVRIASKFDGIGPRLGGRLSWDLGSGLTLVGGAAGSLLVGDLDTRYSQFIPTDPAIVDNNRELIDRSEQQIVPVAEGSLGIVWRFAHSDTSFDATAGYQFEQWFGAQGFMQLPSGTAASGGVDSQLVQDRGDVSFHGPYLNLKVRF
jgi:hypothetical protein